MTQYKNALKPNTSRSNPRRAILIIVVLAIALSLGAFLLLRKSNSEPTRQTEIVTENGNINIEPPTETEKQEAEQNKDELVKQQNQSPPPAGQKQTVNPVIVDAGQYDQSIEVRAYIPGIVEGDGQCTITFTQNAATIVKQLSALPDASTTRCANLLVPRSEFVSAGKWNMAISYTSAKSQGTINGSVEVK